MQKITCGNQSLTICFKARMCMQTSILADISKMGFLEKFTYLQFLLTVFLLYWHPNYEEGVN